MKPRGIGDEQQQQQQHRLHADGGEETDGQQQGVQFLPKVDDPIYSIFIKSLTTDTDIDPAICQQLFDDEDNDPEYVFPDFDNFYDEQEDEYEFRRDRATEIPRWEVKALEQDFVEDGDEPSPLVAPIETDGSESTVKIFWRSDVASSSSVGTPSARSVDSRMGTAKDEARHTEDDNATEDNSAQATTTSSSCSLLNPSPIITKVELDALKVQLEKHVQLLCQAIVGTFQYPELVEPHNKAMLMLHELDALSHGRGIVRSVFDVPTLEAAIYSTHDIKACKAVDLAFAAASAMAEEQRHTQHKHSVELLSHDEAQRPSNETMWVLSRSGAIRYPDLLCPNRFFRGNGTTGMQPAKMGMAPQPSPPSQRFLHSEQLLLAIGLYQLSGVPPRNGKMRNRRSQLVQRFFLPTKRVDQIRNHIRNAHSCPSPNIYQRLIMEAEKGNFPVTYRPDLGEKAQLNAPIEWPAELQPYWLKWLVTLLSKCQTQMVIMDDVADNWQQKHCTDKEQPYAAPIVASTSASGSLSAESSNGCPAKKVHSTDYESSDPKQQQQSKRSRCCVCWTRKMDMDLMVAYKNANGDAEKCVSAFLQSPIQCDGLAVGKCAAATTVEAEKRLDQLLSVASTLRRRGKRKVGTERGNIE